jgi:hypothetical protein
MCCVDSFVCETEEKVAETFSQLFYETFLGRKHINIHDRPPDHEKHHIWWCKEA